MNISLPSIQEQQRIVLEQATKEAIAQLKQNLKAPVLHPKQEIDEGMYSRNHLLREGEGWEPPAPEVVRAYFKYFQEHFPEYDTDKKLAKLLGVSSDRRIREMKEGKKPAYGVWRKFLVLTGRAPQEIIPVLAFMG